MNDWIDSSAPGPPSSPLYASTPVNGRSTPGTPSAPSAARILPGHVTSSNETAPSTKGFLSGSGKSAPPK